MMSKLDRINGAIIGLGDLKGRLLEINKEQKEKTNYAYFKVSNGWVMKFIEHKIQVYKEVKIKELERLHQGGK